MLVRCEGGESFYKFSIKYQSFSGLEFFEGDLLKYFLAIFFSPYVRQEGSRGLELANCSSHGSDKALIKIFSLESWPFLCRTLLVYFKMVTFPLPLPEM